MSDIRAAIVRNDGVIEHVPLMVDVPQRGDTALTWIEVFNPLDRDFAVLQERFGLHKLAVKDSMNPVLAPKLDVYDGQIFVVLKVARLAGDRVEYAKIDAFVSESHIITVRQENDTYVDMHERFGSTPRSARPGPDFILHAILDSVVGNYFSVVQMIEDEVLSMEQRLLDSFLDREQVTRLFRLRREAIHLQHVLTRTSEVCGKLINLDLPCIGAELKPYFRNVHDQLVRLDGMTRGLIDVIRAVFEASSLLEQQRLGASTRKLAGWAAIMGAPTVVAAIYGMNFAQTPALHSRPGYLVVISVMVLISLALYVRFRKLRWL